MIMDGNRTFQLGNLDMLVVCEERTLFVSLPPAVAYDSIMGKTIIVVVRGIADYHGNVHSDPVSWSFKARSIKIGEATAVLRGLVLNEREAAPV